MTDAPRPLRQSSRLAKRAADAAAATTTIDPAPAVKKAKTSSKPSAAKPSSPSETQPSSSQLSVGDSLPAGIVLKDHTGADVDISEIVKTSTSAPVVVFAYPKASTPGCTKQVCGFRDEFPEFNGLGAKVFGLSADSVAAQAKFHDKQGLTYQLLSDPEYKLIEVLGAKKTAKGGVTRSHWVFADGKLAVKEVQISPADSYTKALKEVKERAGKKEDGEKDESKEEAKEEEKTQEEAKEEEPKKEESSDAAATVIAATTAAPKADDASKTDDAPKTDDTKPDDAAAQADGKAKTEDNATKEEEAPRADDEAKTEAK